MRQRAGWEHLRSDLLRTINTLGAERAFQRGCQGSRALEGFLSPSTLVGYLTSQDGDLDRRDAIYRVLVRAVQRQSDWSDVASAILWLGLWPGLDTIYRRRLRLFHQGPDDPVSAIGLCFTTAVRRARLSRINRIAATLTKNTERNLVDELRRGWKRSANEVDGEDERLEEGANEAQKRSGGATDVVSDGFLLKELRSRLLPVIGDDADLLLAVLVLDETQREAADRLGISHAAARKRFQRARARARRYFREACPISPRRPAFLK